MRWAKLPNIFGPDLDPDPVEADHDPEQEPEQEPDTEPDTEPEPEDHLTAGGVILRVLVLLFVACLIFGGAATFGWLHHAWTFVDGVFHSKSPTVHIHLPHISLPTAPVTS